MKNNDFLSTVEVAKMLGISRVAVFKKIQNGEIKANKVGRNYVIAKEDISAVLKSVLTDERKEEIDEAVDKTVKEYGDALKQLGKE